MTMIEEEEDKLQVKTANQNVPFPRKEEQKNKRLKTNETMRQD